MAKAEYDAVVIGAGPAGATAAARLARLGRRVVLVSKPRPPNTIARLGWLHSRADAILTAIGCEKPQDTFDSIKVVELFNADFSKKAKPSLRESPGYLMDRTTFDRALATNAGESGAVLALDCNVTKIGLLEDRVVVTAGEATWDARLLILACGQASTLPREIGLTAEGVVADRCTAFVERRRDRLDGSEARVAVVLGLDRRSGSAFCRIGPDCVSVSVTITGDRTDAISALRSVCNQGYARGALPLDLTSDVDRSVVSVPIAAAALELETHIGKHTLLVGEAGGFVSTISHEEMYPAMWSSMIAAETVHEALGDGIRGAHSQDVLMQFDSSWRMQMADYLRAPHGEIQFLMPLIFSSQPMADRIGAAWFHGENM